MMKRFRAHMARVIADDWRANVEFAQRVWSVCRECSPWLLIGVVIGWLLTLADGAPR